MSWTHEGEGTSEKRGCNGVLVMYCILLWRGGWGATSMSRSGEGVGVGGLRMAESIMGSSGDGDVRMNG